MANFTKAMSSLRVSQDSRDSMIEYCGIQRKFFPKWEGWNYIDNQELPSNEMVNDFYNMYFWAKIRGDEIVNQELAELIFLFSITNGKRKALDKLDRVLGTSSGGIMNSFIIQKINSADIKFLFMYLYSELCEFCIMLDKKKDFCKYLKVYNQFVTSLSL